MPGCLADGRVFNFPFNWLGLAELDPRQPGGSFTRPFSRRQYLSKLTNRIASRLSLFLEYGCLGGEFLIKAAHHAPCKSLSFCWRLSVYASARKAISGSFFQLVSILFSSKAEGSFRQHPECVWFLPARDSRHNEHNRPTGAGVALVVRSVRVGICRLSEFAFSAQCVALLPYLLSPIGDRMQFTKINKSRHAAYALRTFGVYHQVSKADIGDLHHASFGQCAAEVCRDFGAELKECDGRLIMFTC